MIRIKANNIEKIYKIYKKPSERLKEVLFRKIRHKQFVALKNINFFISSGETVGIIGRNGAGKSTLLKIIAQSLEATSGVLEINGRVAALLELGMGFDFELSGEENIHLNAYLIGLTKDEVDAKKQEIIDFSELGEFIRRPVKTYSSGMIVRLAFSIAIAADPDIIILDEALSVGDNNFQKKCIDQIMRLKKNGKTILFCSHSMYHTEQICHKVIWLENGEIYGFGESKCVIRNYENYLREMRSSNKIDTLSDSEQVVEKTNTITIEDIKITNSKNEAITTLKPFGHIVFSCTLLSDRPDIKGHISLVIRRNDHINVFVASTYLEQMPPVVFKDGLEVSFRIESLPFIGGNYEIRFIALDEFGFHVYDQKTSKQSFSIINDKEAIEDLGIVYIDHEWIL